MDLDWKFFGIITVCLIALVFFLIRRNMKDKKDVTRFFNQEADQGSKRDVHDDSDEI